MPFSDPYTCLTDICESIAAIADFTAGMSLEEFHTEEKTVAAVERKLLIIGTVTEGHK